MADDPRVPRQDEGRDNTVSAGWEPRPEAPDYSEAWDDVVWPAPYRGDADGSEESMAGNARPDAGEQPRRKRPGRRERRLNELSDAIALYPDAAANYLLRGELYLNAGEYGLAEADFERALVLAMAQVAADDWGLVGQSVQDRALRGMERARRRA